MSKELSKVCSDTWGGSARAFDQITASPGKDVGHE